MSKRFIFVSLVSFGLIFTSTISECFADAAATYHQAEIYMKNKDKDYEKAKQLYQSVVDNWPQDYYYALKAQAGVAKSNIALGNLGAAQAAVDKLLTDYSGTEHIGWAVLNVAHNYKLFGKYEKAKNLYQHVLDNWPEEKFAMMWSQAGLAESHISLGNTAAAESAIERLLADYSGHLDIAAGVCNLAQYYHHQVRNYEKAGQYYQYVIDHWPSDDYATWSQMGLLEIGSSDPNEASETAALADLAKSNISQGNMEAADEAINKLLTDYSEDERIAGALYEITKQYLKVKKYEDAKMLYQYVLDHWPGNYYAMWSQSGVAICHIGVGDMQAAQAATDALIANFQTSDRIGEAVYDVADQYNRFRIYEKAKQLYQYILDTWSGFTRETWTKIGLAQSYIGLGDKAVAEAITDGLTAKLATDFPSDSALPFAAVQTYYYAGLCYSQVGKYEKSTTCYEKIISGCPGYESAWNAQFQIGRNYQELKKAGLISESEADLKTKVAYERLLEKYPTCPVATDARSWLSRHRSG